ncbi:zinc finger CCCH domain-containing protein 2 [Striga asiatica]|uniref:Zinc finger CCCH domain-containing protein 2 n=1 Tax=Striga asiatica TaxID=4170 RepID=A0A5A7QE00_STRAF|nr:zinc finger CCCH domain-containing protein 2 [Striga asiatica]
MSSIWALRELDISPRNSPRRRPSSAASDQENHFPFSPSGGAAAAALSRFLPRNSTSGSDSDDDHPYSSDHFRMYEFKVRKCGRSRTHVWTDCPFAHPGEKARRRDPRRFRYSAAACPDFRGGACPRGDACNLSHGVFECWLHPSRYRTEACKDGRGCRRKICFFAHSSRQLRLVPDEDEEEEEAPAPVRSCCSHVSRCCPLMAHHVSSPSPSSSPEFSLFRDLDAARYMEVMAAIEAMNVAAGNVDLGPDVDFGLGRGRMGPVRLGRGDFSGRNTMEDDCSYNNNMGNNECGPDLGWVNDLLT